ncbi:hypothetical protein LEP1GSC048_3582 [Leptospira santarosai serovar Shermani str. 1342KT]|nr:hypothetical protein LEP1GSC048_3582 [Leptospira santarosai serovar Shermani str. 1342KT]
MEPPLPTFTEREKLSKFSLEKRICFTIEESKNRPSLESF